MVRAPPADVWSVLVDPQARRDGSAFLREAEPEKGRPGTAGFTVAYRARRRAWREAVAEVERPRRLVVEASDAKTQRAWGRLEWRLEPIDLGTLLVLEVRASDWKQALLDRLWRRSFWRRYVAAIKGASEPEPASVFEMGRRVQGEAPASPAPQAEATTEATAQAPTMSASTARPKRGRGSQPAAAKRRR